MSKQECVVIKKDDFLAEKRLNLWLDTGWLVKDKTILDDKIIYILEKQDYSEINKLKMKIKWLEEICGEKGCSQSEVEVNE